MFGFSVKSVAAVVTAIVLASGATPVEAQSAHRTRRESNANRKARIERTIQDTYSHRWEVGGGGGYLRFRSGEDLRRNNEVTWWLSGTWYKTQKWGILANAQGSYGNAKVGNTIYNIPNPQISQYTFMGGPNYRLWSRQKYAISAFAVGGAALA